jgi:hypothetical protein
VGEEDKGGQEEEEAGKLWAWERGEETDSDDDDDDKEEEDDVVIDIEWGDLGSLDVLTGTHSSMQGPFPFHAKPREVVYHQAIE